MKNLSMIAAVGKNLELGKNNQLIWRFKEDMQFFKSQTINKPVVMGMNTLNSLPRLLPQRQHIVLTRKNISLPPEIIVVHSIDELLNYVYHIVTFKDGKWQYMATIDDEYREFNEGLIVQPSDSKEITAIHVRYMEGNCGLWSDHDEDTDTTGSYQVEIKYKPIK